MRISEYIPPQIFTKTRIVIRGALSLSLSLEGMNRSLQLKVLKGFTYLERVGKMQGSDGWYCDPCVSAVGNLTVTKSDTCVFLIKWTDQIWDSSSARIEGGWFWFPIGWNLHSWHFFSAFVVPLISKPSAFWFESRDSEAVLEVGTREGITRYEQWIK